MRDPTAAPGMEPRAKAAATVGQGQEEADADCGEHHSLGDQQGTAADMFGQQRAHDGCDTEEAEEAEEGADHETGGCDFPPRGHQQWSRRDMGHHGVREMSISWRARSASRVVRRTPSHHR